MTASRRAMSAKSGPPLHFSLRAVMRSPSFVSAIIVSAAPRNAEMERGSSALRGAADTMVAVLRERDHRVGGAPERRATPLHLGVLAGVMDGERRGRELRPDPVDGRDRELDVLGR